VNILLIAKNLQCKVRGIFVILENYKPLLAKSFDLKSIFNFIMGLIANMLKIITLVALLHFSPKI